MNKIQYIALSALLVIGVALGGFAGSCAFAPKSANAQEGEAINSTLFQVVDADNNIKIQLGIDDSGQPLMALFDRNGNRREVMSMSEDGTPMFIMIDDSNNPRMVFGVDNTEGAAMSLYKADRTPIWTAVK